MGRKLLTVLAGCATLLLAGCHSPTPRTPSPRNATFIPDEYAAYKVAGTGAIEGQAFMVTRGGGAVKGAGRSVLINPSTSYSREWFDRIGRNELLAAGDPRANEFTREVQADADGRFRVEGLAPGDYLVACWITWEVPQAAGWGGTYMSNEGGIARGIVTVENGKTSTVIVTR